MPGPFAVLEPCGIGVADTPGVMETAHLPVLDDYGAYDRVQQPGATTGRSSDCPRDDSSVPCRRPSSSSGLPAMPSQM
jgi:hypothetical protein